MPIRWNVLQVSEAADMIEEFVNQAAQPLEQVRIVAQEARKIANLPQYVDQHLCRIISDVERAIGGGQFDPVGRLRSGVQAIRKDIPESAIEEERAKLKIGRQQALM